MVDADMMETDTMDMSITPTTSYPDMDVGEDVYSTASAAGKAIQPPPHLHARNRNDSLISIDTTYTVRTNVEQTHFPPTAGQPHLGFGRNRQGSTTSLSSSVFSEMPPPQMDTYSFTPVFDDELYSYYLSYAQQPNITPFDTRFPPSGILSLISKLFLEHCILANKVQIDSRPDVNAELVADSNRHKCLAIIRLRLIHICNANLNAAEDQYMYTDQLPISRTNSIASAISLGDRVIPGISAAPGGGPATGEVFPQQIPLPMAHRPSWLHMPNLYSTSSRGDSNTANHMLSSTDSLVDRVPASLSFTPGTNTNTIPTANPLNENADYTTPTGSTLLQGFHNDSNGSGNADFAQTTPPNTGVSSKRGKPTLNLHMPSFLKYRSSQYHNMNAMPPRPLFSTGPATPGTPGTPNTPVGSTSSAQRNPRGVRSGSLSNQGANYFNLTPTNGSNAAKNFLNPALHHLQGPNGGNFGSSSDLHSPFEQACPSPLAFSAPPGGVLSGSNEVSTPTMTTTPLVSSVSTPTTAAASVPNPSTPDLYNATVARKRDSLNLKRGLN